MNLVLIETSGNQRYIFSTNKLSENVGASELTNRVGTQFVLEAVVKKTGRILYEHDDLSGGKVRRNLLNRGCNPEVGEKGCPVEVIIATSGKALLLVTEGSIGKDIVRDVTKRALSEAPGLTVHGAISEDFDDLSQIHDHIGSVHRRLEDIRYELPTVDQRFLRLPFVAPCATSGLPATLYSRSRPKAEARSIVSVKKRQAADDGRLRIDGMVSANSSGLRLIRTIHDLEKRFEELDWLAVIHADGNGVGQIFLEFDKHIQFAGNGREYLDKYRRFSMALDVCTVNATRHALTKLQDRLDRERKDKKDSDSRYGPNQLPVVPIVLGGDDLTVLGDGRHAVLLTADFLTEFEKESATIDHDHFEGIISQVAKSAFGVGRLSICAGVAIVKPHFPFHAAYELAESLLKSAKKVKEEVKHKTDAGERQLPCSALDFHILYDSSGGNLELIRQKLRVDDGQTHLYARPYVVTGEEELRACRNKWLKARMWTVLQKRVEAMRAEDPEDPGRRALPNSMLHEVREGLFLGQEEADARMKLVRTRYSKKGFGDLLEEEDPPKGQASLFVEEKHDGKGGRSTGYLDAIDLVEFWK